MSHLLLGGAGPPSYLCVCVSLSLCLPLPVSPSLSLSLFLSVPLSSPLSLHLSLPSNLCLSLSLPPSISVSVSLSCLSSFFSTSISHLSSFCLCLSLSLSPSISLGSCPGYSQPGTGMEGGYEQTRGTDARSVRLRLLPIPGTHTLLVFGQRVFFTSNKSSLESPASSFKPGKRSFFIAFLSRENVLSRAAPRSEELLPAGNELLPAAWTVGEGVRTGLP